MARSKRQAAMVDMNLKVPALEKLMDYTASGIGAVAGPMLAPWRARREAEAKLIESEAEAGSLKLIANAQAEARRSLIAPDEAGRGMLNIGSDGIQQRIEFQEKKRQANITAVVRDAAAELGDREVAEHEPNPDWTARFFDCVQDVSSEDMQKLWSKVLSGEVESPGRTSLRTLDVLKNMTHRDAQIFQDVCSYVIGDFVFDSDDMGTNFSALQYNNLLILQDTGLINLTPGITWRYNFTEEDYVFTIPHHNFTLRIATNPTSFTLHVNSYPLTIAGNELHKFAKCEPDMDYLKSFSRFPRSEGCELSFSRVVERNSDGSIVRSSPFIPIEPKGQISGDTIP